MAALSGAILSMKKKLFEEFAINTKNFVLALSLTPAWLQLRRPGWGSDASARNAVQPFVIGLSLFSMLQTALEPGLNDVRCAVF